MKKIILLLIAFQYLTSCQNDEIDDSQLGAEYIIKVNLEHKVGTQNYVNGTTYTNGLGEQYNLTKFHYYISNISMVRQANNLLESEVNSYHFVKADDVNTHSFTYKVNSNLYDALVLTIGVDSLRNVSGAQTGALDPLNGMFWTWSTGYIMAKMEGSSPQSTAVNNSITYHIGGFSGANNVLRTVLLPLPTGAMQTNRSGTCVITLNVDINKWFNAVHNLPIASLNTTMSPGATAAKYADNYAKMFTIKSVVNQ